MRTLKKQIDHLAAKNGLSREEQTEASVRLLVQQFDALAKRVQELEEVARSVGAS